MAQPFVIERRVEFRDTDAAGIMHFSAYFTYMEQAEHELLRHLGLSVMTQDEEGPISWPRVSAGCDYQGSVKFEDMLQIAVRVSRLGEKSITYEFTFTHDGSPVAEGRIVAVCCRFLPGEPPKSIAIPAWIAEKLEAVVAER